jgi:hypothetical protein
LRRIVGRLGLGLVISAATAGPALALDWGGAVGLATEKVGRGLSQSGHQPSWLLDLGLRTTSGWGLVLGLSSLHDQSAAEGVLSLAHQRQLDEQWQVQWGLAYYGYTGEALRGQDYSEVFAAFSWDGRGALMAAYSPDTRFFKDGAPRRLATLQLEASWHQRLAGRLALDVGLGLLAVDGLGSYRYGSAGLAWSQGPWQYFLTYTRSDAAERGFTLPTDPPGRWVASVLWRF